METTEEKDKPRCPRCKSRRTVKFGFHITSRNQQAVRSQRYQCKKCGHVFFKEK